MKKYLLMFLLCACAWGCAACAGKQQADSEPISELEETAETTAVTTTTTAETTTVTTTTTVDYLTAPDLKLEVKTDTVRPAKCTAELKNTGSEAQHYTLDFRIYEKDGEKERLCKELEDYEPAAAQDRWIAPDETAELNYEWSARYGDLQDGTYILEALLGSTAEDPDDPESPQRKLVARAEFEMDSAGFVPQFIIDPEDINPQGIVLHIKNANDVPRYYAMTYHLYDESRTPRVELLGEIDKEAQLHGNNYMPAGGELVLVYDWSNSYGSLIEGEYVLEIPLLAEGEKEGKIYRIPFEIT